MDENIDMTNPSPGNGSHTRASDTYLRSLHSALVSIKKLETIYEPLTELSELNGVSDEVALGLYNEVLDRIEDFTNTVIMDVNKFLADLDNNLKNYNFHS